MNASKQGATHDREELYVGTLHQTGTVLAASSGAELEGANRARTARERRRL